MFRYFFAFLLICHNVLSGFSQDKYLHDYFSHQDSLLQLNHIELFKDSFFLRIYQSGEVLEISQGANALPGGRRICYYLMPCDKEKQHNIEVFKSESKLTTAEIDSILKGWQRIKALPNDDSIWCWHHDSLGNGYTIFDGWLLCIASKVNGIIATQKYYGPAVSSVCEEAKMVGNLKKTIHNLPRSEKQTKTLLSTLPAGTYTNDGLLWISKPNLHKVSRLRYLLMKLFSRRVFYHENP